MLSFVYYISGHGYGHAVRSRQVIRALKKSCPKLHVHIRTSAPPWLLAEPAHCVSYGHRVLDVGVLQKDSLEMEVEKTLAACRAFQDEVPRLMEEEIAFIRTEAPWLILGDIPPLSFEISARASLPSVAIGNFTWSWIYRAYLPEFPSFLPLIQEMESFYRKATLALSLPFSCDMEIFPRLVSIPLITRVSNLDKEGARKKYGLPLDLKVVLVSFGGFGLERLAWKDLSRYRDFFFVTTGQAPRKEGNLAILSEQQPRYEDLVRAADAVISKPGYGIVADVIAHRVPLLYTARGPFPEYSYLVEALQQWTTSEFIPQEELLLGNLIPYLERLLSRESNWPRVSLNGAEVAAERILALLGVEPFQSV